jgi:hypothetical protein
MTKPTGYPVIDEILESIAPKTTTTTKHDCIDAQGNATGLFCPACASEREVATEFYQCDACGRIISDEDEVRRGIRGGGEGTFCAQCCGETQPPSDSGGEWRVEHFTRDGADEWMVVTGMGRTVALSNINDSKLAEAEMKQIVSDHFAVSRLVQALEDMIDLWAREQKIINGNLRNVEYDSQVIAARKAIALALATTRKGR